VVRQVRESDMDLEPRFPAGYQPPSSAATTTLSSPNLVAADSIEEPLPDEVMLMDLASGSGAGFKQQAIINSHNAKGRNFWETFSDRTTPPPPAFLPRGSSSGISLDDMSMDSPLQTTTTNSSATGPTGNPFTMATGIQRSSISLASLPPTTTTSSSDNNTPQPVAAPNSQEASQLNTDVSNGSGTVTFTQPRPRQTLPPPLPTAAEITRRINSKRRRDDDFDPVSFKRRAVSPGMGTGSSVQGSPVMQSPLQRDNMPWGSRPGSGAGLPGNAGGWGGLDKEREWERGRQLERDGTSGSGSGGRVTGKGRVGFQGMVDTNDGITKLTLE
jgi:hypothetical protein